MVGGVKAVILLLAVVLGQSVLAADKKPLTKKEEAEVKTLVAQAELRRKRQEAETEADLLMDEQQQHASISLDLDVHRPSAFDVIRLILRFAA